MEVSVSAAFGHIQSFMHPQVMITDDPSREDGFFTRATRAKTLELGRTVIELPTDASENLMWIARLDSGSLAGNTPPPQPHQLLADQVLAWQTTYVDILIHAPPYSSGSLLRLLKSIEAADYFGHRRPHLTIELPADIDPPTLAYLEELTWPPLDWSGSPHVSQVTLRHRVPRSAGTAEEASIRHVESFYPARPVDSHVLVLSPQVELSPLYFHFLMYQLLEHRYSSLTREFPQVKNLIGLSLELPSTYLNGTLLFNPPTKTPKSNDSDNETLIEEERTSFLWQAPNSNAALYFGDKWIELHSFLTSRLANDPTKQPGRRKIISELYPGWLEYLQELMRARGYTMLYPNFLSGGRDSIASLHHELFQAPEEFAQKPKPASVSQEAIPKLDPKETFETDLSTHPLKPKSLTKESTPLTSNLLSLLPAASSSSNPSDILTDLSDLPLLSHEGNPLDPLVFESTARVFANHFRRNVGGCPGTHRPVIEPMRTDDLFCAGSEGLGTGLSLGDLYNGPSAPLPPPPPPIKDDSEARQREFEAHLSRQGGGGVEEKKKKVEKAKLRNAAEKEVVEEKAEINPKGNGAKEDVEGAKAGADEDKSAGNAKERLREEKIGGKDGEKEDKKGDEEGAKEEKPRGW